MPLTVTFDLEDNRRSTDQEERFVRMSHRFLEYAAERDITATVFIVGEIARTHPELIRAVAAAGHEIALHGLRHVTLETVGPEHLGDELRQGRALLEDIAQVPVRGFRAPIFSLTPSMAWALDDMAAAGFTYSSSVLPAHNPLHGWPGVPTTPFRWANGLVELPCPVAGAGRMSVPYLGGIYLRYIPVAIGVRALARAPADAVSWSYCHPYDLDPDEDFFVMPHAGWLTSRILHTRRRATLPRLDRLIAAAGGAGPTMAALSEAAGMRDLPLVR